MSYHGSGSPSLTMPRCSGGWRGVSVGRREFEQGCWHLDVALGLDLECRGAPHVEAVAAWYYADVVANDVIECLWLLPYVYGYGRCTLQHQGLGFCDILGLAVF